ncbi:MAG: hypothetical protein JJE18_07670 [Eubacteriaceae bacterium]|nr:hypothetical protein [Eubacteriaceae bacterium]
MEEKAKKELNQLYMSELITAFVCGALIYVLSESPGGALDIRLILPGAILIFIILESAGYWFYRHQLAENPGVHYAWIMPLFSFLKKLNPYLFFLYPLLCLYLLIFYPGSLLVPMNFFGLILYSFSILENINYFYYSINFRNLKTKIPSELARDLSLYAKKKGNKS